MIRAVDWKRGLGYVVGLGVKSADWKCRYCWGRRRFFPVRGQAPITPQPHYRSGLRKAAGLKHVPLKPWLQKWLRRLPMGLLDRLILFTTGKAAYGSFPVDLTYHRFNRPVLVDVYSTTANRNGKKSREGYPVQ